MTATGTSARKADEIAASPGISWAAVFGVLLGLAAALLWWPLERIPAHYSIIYNEGWNSYLQTRAAAGTPIYGQPPQYVYANYPPLSFHLVGLFGRVTGNVVAAGRWISAASFFAIAVLIGLTVRRLTGAARCGVYASLAFVIFLAVFDADYIGMNDPHLLGMAFGMAGVYCLVAGGTRPWAVYLSAAAFAVSLFTKQSQMAVPAAVAIYLLRTSPRDLARWLATAAAVSAALTGVVYALDGPYFLQHLAFPRAYTFVNVWEEAGWGAYLVLFQAPIAVALCWALFAARGGVEALVVWSFALTHAFAAWFGTGAGVNRNILFEPIVWLAVMAGLAAPYAARWTAGRTRTKPLLAIVLLVPFLGVWAWLMGGRVHADLTQSQGRAASEAEYAQALDVLRSRPGDALCETPLMCYQAGKPQTYDPYMLGQLFVAGKLREDDLLRLVNERRMAVIELEMPDHGAAVEQAGRERLPGSFVDRVRQEYTLALKTANYVVYTPKAAEPRPLGSDRTPKR
jgi:hypothetical protein